MGRDRLAAEGGDTVGLLPRHLPRARGRRGLATVVDRVKAITGRIDLVHANDSRDAFDSGADRHANFGAGHIDARRPGRVVREAGAPVVCETPGGADGQGADIAWLREHVD